MIFDKDAIKKFVQRTLGCGCPEKVFEYIDCQSNIKLNNIILKYKINISNRLLIHIAEINDQNFLENTIAFLVREGKKERDGLKFNRFRLVLLTDRVDEIKGTAESIFEEISKDEKVHLHIVDKKEVPDFLAKEETALQ